MELPPEILLEILKAVIDINSKSLYAFGCSCAITADYMRQNKRDIANKYLIKSENKNTKYVSNKKIKKYITILGLSNGIKHGINTTRTYKENEISKLKAIKYDFGEIKYKIICEKLNYDFMYEYMDKNGIKTYNDDDVFGKKITWNLLTPSKYFPAGLFLTIHGQKLSGSFLVYRVTLKLNEKERILTGNDLENISMFEFVSYKSINYILKTCEKVIGPQIYAKKIKPN